MAELEILGFPVSNYVRSIRMLCVEKGVPYTLVQAYPQSPDVLAISPAGQIPCLRHGDVTLFESRAIAGYIDAVFPGPNLLPQEPLQAAITEQWISYGNAKVDRWIMRECVVPFVFAKKDIGPDMTRINAALPQIKTILGVLDARLAQSAYLAGPSLTYADLNIVPMLWALQTLPFDKDLVDKRQALSRYYGVMSNRASFSATEPPPRRDR